MVKMMMTTTNVAQTGTEAARRTGLEVMWLLEKLAGRDQVSRFEMGLRLMILFHMYGLSFSYVCFDGFVTNNPCMFVTT